MRSEKREGPIKGVTLGNASTSAINYIKHCFLLALRTGAGLILEGIIYWVRDDCEVPCSLFLYKKICCGIHWACPEEWLQLGACLQNRTRCKAGQVSRREKIQRIRGELAEHQVSSTLFLTTHFPLQLLFICTQT